MAVKKKEKKEEKKEEGEKAKKTKDRRLSEMVTETMEGIRRMGW